MVAMILFGPAGEPVLGLSGDKRKCSISTSRDPAGKDYDTRHLVAFGAQP